MINIFKIEDLEKYPELHISIINLFKEWLDTQTKFVMKN